MNKIADKILKELKRHDIISHVIDIKSIIIDVLDKDQGEIEFITNPIFEHIERERFDTALDLIGSAKKDSRFDDDYDFNYPHLRSEIMRAEMSIILAKNKKAVEKVIHMDDKLNTGEKEK